jgi:hypothetical protein
MKKGLGLQANISGFNTTLPQTKHLNFFMGTNPVGYANGGAVRRGIPSSNMNVTQGFLPMALGFENGGDVSMYNAVVKTIAKYLVATQNLFKGKSENDPDVLAEAENIAQTQPELAEAISTGIGEYAAGVPAGGGKEPPMPTETIKEPDKKINFGGMMDDLGNIIKQKKDEFKEEGIDALFPDSLVEFRDNLLGPEKIQTDIGEYRFPQPDSVEQTPKKQESKKDEKSIIDKGLDIIEDAIYKDDDKPSKKEDKKDEKTITAEPDETDKPVDSGTSGITSIMDSGARKEFSEKEAKDASKGIADLTGNKGKKDIPEWALPLASAGFAMMASKSPYFLQALGEAGQEGIKTLATQKELEQDKLDKEAERAFLEARTEQIGRPDAPFKIGNAFYRYDENNKLVKVRNIQRSLTEIEDDLRTRIVGYDNLDLAERQELIKKEQLSDQNILYQGDTTEATKDNDRNILDSIKDYIGL